MNGQQFYDLVLSRLGKRSSAEMRQLAIQETTQALDTLQRTSWSPWFLMQEWLVDVAAEVDRVDTTKRVISIDEEYPFLQWIPADEYDTPPECWRLLERVPAYKIQRNPIVLGTVEPTKWFRTPKFDTLEIQLDSYTPVAGKLLVQANVAEATVPDSQSDDNLWLKYGSRWLMCEAASIVAASHLQHGELAAMLQQEAERERESHYVHTLSMQQSQRGLVKGDE